MRIAQEERQGLGLLTKSRGENTCFHPSFLIYIGGKAGNHQLFLAPYGT